MVTVIFARRVRLTGLIVGVLAGLAALAGTLSAPIRADMLGNAFLSALTNAGIAYTQPTSTMAMGQSVYPMLFEPGGSFDAVTADMAQRAGMSYETAGRFTIVAIATYCPAVIAPLLGNRLAS
ncbi:DUF732 domain-containing protein [Mycobacterium avium]|uniref:DUF732 domain-containing protein n=1 Tax=Mycobacterium avium TaxID=1764 RepID=UPI000308D5FA|nr:DUF732 domain-containing protein [Mycobacterium avium]AZP81023.1 DUF732 domain-containing protein [Mycobacterium avium subsp. paratuberculosis]WPS77999.1 DUF732 domain-containing protein [Mycobacterium avium subsp. paratuberculosis]